MTGSGSRCARRPRRTASASFSYAATDGTSAGGLLSAPITVTLTVAAAAQRVRAGLVRGAGMPRHVAGAGGRARRHGHRPGASRAGSTRRATRCSCCRCRTPPAIGSVAATPAGEVVYQHSDDGSGDEELIELTVTMADTWGATVTKPLLVRVSPEPVIAVQSFAVVDTIDAGMSIDVAPHVTGTAGAISLESVHVLDEGCRARRSSAAPRPSTSPPALPGVYRVDFTVTDGLSEATGTARITVLPADAPADLATPPVVVFVHPQEDATSTCSRSRRTRPAECSCSATSSPGPIAGRSSPSTRSARTTCGFQARRRPARPGAWGRSPTRSATAPTIAAPRAGRGDRLSAAAGPRARADRGRRHRGRARRRADRHPGARQRHRAGRRATHARPVVGRRRRAAPRWRSRSGGRAALSRARHAGGVRRRVRDLHRRRSVARGCRRGAHPRAARRREPGAGAGDARGPGAERSERRRSSSTGSAWIRTAMSSRSTASSRSRRAASRRSRPTASRSSTRAWPDSAARCRSAIAWSMRSARPARAPCAGRGAGRPVQPEPDHLHRLRAGAGRRAAMRPGSVRSRTTSTPPRGRSPSRRAAGCRADARRRLREPRIRAARRPDRSRPPTAPSSSRPATEPETMSFLYDVVSSSGNTGRGLIVVRVVRESVPDYPVVADTVLTVENREDFTRGVDVLTGKATLVGRRHRRTSRSALWGEPAGRRGRRLGAQRRAARARPASSRSR